MGGYKHPFWIFVEPLVAKFLSDSWSTDASILCDELRQVRRLHLKTLQDQRLLGGSVWGYFASDKSWGPSQKRCGHDGSSHCGTWGRIKYQLTIRILWYVLAIVWQIWYDIYRYDRKKKIYIYINYIYIYIRNRRMVTRNISSKPWHVVFCCGQSPTTIAAIHICTVKCDICILYNPNSLAQLCNPTAARVPRFRCSVRSSVTVAHQARHQSQPRQDDKTQGNRKQNDGKQGHERQAGRRQGDGRYDGGRQDDAKQELQPRWYKALGKDIMRNKRN